LKKIARFKSEDLLLNFDKIRSDVTDFIRGNPITIGAVALGVPLTFAGIRAVGRRAAKRRKTTRKKVSGRRKTTRKRTTRKRTTRRKRSGLSRGRKQKIKMTKKGQPYIILPNGRARFIKKSSARLARKRKGGYT